MLYFLMSKTRCRALYIFITGTLFLRVNLIVQLRHVHGLPDAIAVRHSFLGELESRELAPRQHDPQVSLIYSSVAGFSFRSVPSGNTIVGTHPFQFIFSKSSPLASLFPPLRSTVS